MTWRERIAGFKLMLMWRLTKRYYMRRAKRRRELMAEIEAAYPGFLYAVRQILLKDWDPIGLGEDCPEDEYDHYAEGLARSLSQGLTREGLVKELAGLEKEAFSMEPDEMRAEEVADKLLEAWDRARESRE
jgi:hypothetical protein